MDKNNFPIFKNNKNLIYFDNWATTQKPDFVIDSVNNYIKKYNSNIHRWVYWIAENSEDIYIKSKKTVADFIWAKWKEIIYTYNSSYSLNILAQTLTYNNILWKWDKILLWIWEHNSNVVSWQILSKYYGFSIDFINLDDDFNIDFKDFEKKYTSDVKVVSLSQVSNVIWKIFDIKKIKSWLRSDTFFVVDATQSIPHFSVNVDDIWADALIFTWHKMFAYTWIWVLYLREKYIEKMQSFMWWWGTIKYVKKNSVEFQSDYLKFEYWTPNIIWAVSLSSAIEFINLDWWIKKLSKYEKTLIEYFFVWIKKRNLEKFFLWLNIPIEKKIWNFVFQTEKNNLIIDLLAQKNICVRWWGHCAHIFHSEKFWDKWTIRVSLYFYNTKDDIDFFLDTLKNIIENFL